MTTAHIFPQLTSEIHSLPGTDFMIFGLSPDYDPQHHDRLQSLAASVGAGFTGLCFTVHREVMAQHDGYVGELLTEASNHGLLP
jgi:hypothetical protein